MDGRAGQLPGGIRERLTLWARQHAWLHTVPRRKEETGRKAGAAGPAPRARVDAFLERRERGDDPPELDLPDPGADQCLIDWLFEAGAMTWTESGPRPLAWSEWMAWQAMTQTALSSWQAATLMALSSAYAASAGAALDPACPAPMLPAIDDPRIGSQVSAILALFARPAEPEEN